MSLPADLLIHEVTRVRPTTSTDGWNNPTETGTTRTAGIAVRLQQDTHAEVYMDGRTPTEQRWRMYSNEPDWHRADRVEWDQGPDGLLVFEMFGEPNPVYDRESLHHVEATLRIVDG